jgi:amyloid beta A4 precursor protein-binding family A member 2
LLRGGIAERGGVRVGHRIIEINNSSVVATPHEKIVSILANSVGEVTFYFIFKILINLL